MAEKTTDPIEIDPKDIKELMQFYGFQDNLVYDPYAGVDEVEPKAAYASEVLRCLIMHHYNHIYPNLRELLSLIKFLKHCKGDGESNPLKLSRRITAQNGYELKGQEKTIMISDNYILTALELFVNTLMYEWYEPQLEHGWTKAKKPLISNPMGFIYGDIFSTYFRFHEPFEDNEIDELSKHIVDRIKHTQNGRLGSEAEYFIVLLGICNISFNNKTKHYSFVYDLMRLAKQTGNKCITGEGFSGDIGREKYQQVSNWLRANCKYGLGNLEDDYFIKYIGYKVRRTISILLNQHQHCLQYT